MYDASVPGDKEPCQQDAVYSPNMRTIAPSQRARLTLSLSGVGEIFGLESNKKQEVKSDGINIEKKDDAKPDGSTNAEKSVEASLPHLPKPENAPLENNGQDLDTALSRKSVEKKVTSPMVATTENSNPRRKDSSKNKLNMSDRVVNIFSRDEDNIAEEQDAAKRAARKSTDKAVEGGSALKTSKSASLQQPSVLAMTVALNPTENTYNSFSEYRRPIQDTPLHETVKINEPSLRSSGYGAPGSRDISEPLVAKAKHMKMTFFALAINAVILIVLAKDLSSEDPFTGLLLPGVKPSTALHVAGVAIFYVLQICSSVTQAALEEATNVLFGYLFCGNKGLSLAAIGFAHTSTFEKAGFCNKLPLKSKIRSPLLRYSFVYMILGLFSIFTIFIATDIVLETVTIANDSCACVHATDGNEVLDRGWPTMDVEAGVAEYVFGSSIGRLRSEEPVSITEAIYPPSIISVVDNGDTIEGAGFSALIASNCSCADIDDADYLLSLNVDKDQLSNMTRLYKELLNAPGYSAGLTNTSEDIKITNIFSGLNLCGGSSDLNLPFVCETHITEHKRIQVVAKFMTDGTPASIAVDRVDRIVGPDGIDGYPASLDRLAHGLNAVMNGPVSSYNLPITFPGSLPPLLYWTSPNLISPDRGIFDGGVETFYAILFKAAIQRTFPLEGGICSRTNLNKDISTSLTLGTLGKQLLYIQIVSQLVVCFYCLGVFILWARESRPIGPGIKLMDSVAYFLVLLNCSPTSEGLSDFANSEVFEIWHHLDHKQRVGEDLSSVEEETGQITLDVPGRVLFFNQERRYK